ncbi:MAG: hypothetical protein SF187_10380 [Deltaproteobacteria bacterium]|nr:hypothetical protein [Deltaproteobacteria bacterium]
MTRWLFQAFVVAALLSARDPSAFASPSSDVTDSLKSASAAFAQQNWASASESIQRAKQQARDGGLANDKLMAKALVHEGAVVAAQGRANESIAVFRHALQIDAGAKLTAVLAARPEVLDAFKKAVLLERSASAPPAAVSAAPAAAEPPAPTPAPPPPKPAAAPAPVAAPVKAAPEAAKPAPQPEQTAPVVAAKAPPAPEPPAPAPKPAPAAVPKPESAKPAAANEPEEPDLPASLPRPLHCPNPDEAPPGHKAVLRCVAQPELDVARVLLFYRLPGNENYETVPAAKTPRGWYVAVVPAKAFSGKVMQYYFEARDSTDKSVADNGRFESPNIMIVSKVAPPVVHNALAGVRMENDANVGEAEEENPISRLFNNERESTGAKYWVSLMVGRGLGHHGSTTLEWYGSEVSAGFHGAGTVHFVPEFGVQLAPHFAMALQLRSQVIVHSGSKGNKPGAPAAGANAGLLRLIWFLPVGEFSNFQISALAGAGEGFRLVVAPNEVNGRTSSDTVRGGPILAGLGLHTDIAFTRTWALRLGLEVLQGFGNSATVIDFAGGLVAWF